MSVVAPGRPTRVASVMLLGIARHSINVRIGRIIKDGVKCTRQFESDQRKVRYFALKVLLESHGRYISFELGGRPGHDHESVHCTPVPLTSLHNG